MVERQGPDGRFYGCRRYPACKGTRNIEGTYVKHLADQIFAECASTPSKEQVIARTAWREQLHDVLNRFMYVQ